jgi:hypothetical protein
LRVIGNPEHSTPDEGFADIYSGPVKFGKGIIGRYYGAMDTDESTCY